MMTMMMMMIIIIIIMFSHLLNEMSEQTVNGNLCYCF